VFPILKGKAVSVAFTREEDYEAQAANLPDRPISHHPNLVTREGLDAIEDALAKARAAYMDAQTAGGVSADRTAMARATRDLRYWSARRATAQLTEPAPAPRQVQFGRAVHIEREDGRRQTFRIVGEDEADPSTGKISYVSPLAQVLLGKEEGDLVQAAGSEVEILKVD
jgi:transcription elongation GreA/GreB family factor